MTGEELKSKYQLLLTEVLDCLDEGSVTQVIGFSGNGCLRKSNAINIGGGGNSNVIQKNGKATFNGTGVLLTFLIAHTLDTIPSSVQVTPSTLDSLYPYYVTVNSTNISINYTIAPPTGTNNISFFWTANA